jgi:hypothetical protein
VGRVVEADTIGEGATWFCGCSRTSRPFVAKSEGVVDLCDPDCVFVAVVIHKNMIALAIGDRNPCIEGLGCSAA